METDNQPALDNDKSQLSFVDRFIEIFDNKGLSRKMTFFLKGIEDYESDLNTKSLKMVKLFDDLLESNLNKSQKILIITEIQTVLKRYARWHSDNITLNLDAIDAGHISAKPADIRKNEQIFRDYYHTFNDELIEPFKTELSVLPTPKKPANKKPTNDEKLSLSKYETAYLFRLMFEKKLFPQKSLIDLFNAAQPLIRDISVEQARKINWNHERILKENISNVAIFLEELLENVKTDLKSKR